MVFKFTIDKVLDRFIPNNQTYRLPRHVRRFFGNHNPSPVADYWVWLEILVATFCGIALLEGVFKSHTVFSDHNAPMIIASYGAAAILCYNASAAPLAQPRNVFFGQIISSVVGMGIAKLFGLSSNGRDHYWASGALSVAVSSVLMSVCNCVHPPAGSSALLPSIDAQIRKMSWWYIPVQMISSLLMMSVALITGNLIRKYPMYWWHAGLPQNKAETNVDMKLEPAKSTNDGLSFTPHSHTIGINCNQINIPTELELSTLEIEWLEVIQEKLIQMPSKNNTKYS
mmetsp:Transcript_9194/g.9110  ORF Transcript_9194/g.9110 Transcript_9194/m.9110 type:complete len:284 (-) Transcript_9194:1370-2221(-)